MAETQLRIVPGEVDGTRPVLTFVGFSPSLGTTIEADVDPLLLSGILSDRADLGNSGRLQIFVGDGPHPTQPNDMVASNTVVQYMGQQFTLVASKPSADVLAPIAVFSEGFLKQSSIALAFVLAVGLMLARTITAPLSRLSRAMNRVAEMNYGAEIHDRERGDELGGLARQLDSLRASLLDAANSARELAFKGASFDRTDAALMLMASDLTILYTNDTMQRFMRDHRVALERHAPKFEPDAIIGRPLDLVFAGAFRMKGALADEKYYSEEIHLGAAHFRLDCTAVYGDEGVTFGYLVRWHDITARRREAGLHNALEALVPTAEFSQDGRLLTANKPFRSWTGQSETTEVGRKWCDLFEGDCPFETTVPSGPFALTARSAPLRPSAVSLETVHGRDGVIETFVLVALPDAVLGEASTGVLAAS